MALRLYMDHDSSDRRVVAALRAAGIDVLTAFEVGNRDLPDSEQLAFALAANRVIYTANAPDYARLNREWAEAGRLHGGIVLRVPQSVPVGDQIRALARICSELTSDEIRGGLEFIRSWLD